jgi:outer membrane protein assembly factor BamA
MWLPILSHADGYGFSYGARTTLVEPFGKQTRLSVPLTGGERKAALEVERTFASGPIDLLRGTVSATRRVNPFYGESDRRFEAAIRGEQAITRWLRAGAGGRVTDNAFGILDGRTRGVEADVTVDTRLDPSLPRNAIYASTGVERMSFDGAPVALRWTTDLRGYVGLGGVGVGSAVLALRAATSRSDTPLPLFEQALLGGSGSVRGYRTGHRAGDNSVTLSAELRYALSSPLRQSRLGVKAFIDGGAAWAAAGRLEDQPFERGIGGGVYFGGGPFILDLDIAWPETGKPRAHFGLGVSF